MTTQPRLRALVTGASGYVGSRLCRHLAARDWDVHAILRPGSNLGRAGGLPGVTRHVLAPSGQALGEALAAAAPDVVFHLAAATGVADDAPIERLIDGNIRFAAGLAEALRRTPRAALVHAATWWEWDADGRFAPAQPYAATKAAGRILLESAARNAPFAMASLVLHDVYGPGDWRGKVLDLMMRAALEGSELGLSPGRQHIDLVHVDDVAAAFEITARALCAGGAAGHPALYSVATGRTVGVRALAGAVERATGRTLRARWGARDHARGAPLKPGAPAPPPPGWTPRIGLDEGLRTLLKETAQ